MAVGRVWRVRRPFGDIELEVLPGAPDAETRSASIRAVQVLLQDFHAGSPEARRALLEIDAHLRGPAERWAAWPPSSRGIDSVRGQGVAEDLLRAARAGFVVARRPEPRSVPVPDAEPSTPELGPDSSQEAAPVSKSWIGLTLVDQTGTPVPNRQYRIIKPDGTQLDGMLDSNGAAMITGLDPGSCQIWCPYVEPHPGTTYAVQPGDHVSGIAERFGFDDYTTVWNHPDNADLQSQRTDPHVLQPGDSLAIPEVKAQPPANKPTSAKHPFQIQRTPLKLRVTLLDLLAKPMANVAVTLAGNALTTDGQGLVEATIDKSVKDAKLVAGGNEVALSLGGLNPSDDTSESGYKARLYNLGFLWDPTVDDSDDELLIALQDFQARVLADGERAARRRDQGAAAAGIRVLRC